jgi:hypothetical protein
LWASSPIIGGILWCGLCVGLRIKKNCSWLWVIGSCALYRFLSAFWPIVSMTRQILNTEKSADMMPFSDRCYRLDNQVWTVPKSEKAFSSGIAELMPFCIEGCVDRFS